MLKSFICSAKMALSPLAKKLRNSSNTGSHFDAKRGASEFEAPLFLHFDRLNVPSLVEGLKAHARYFLCGEMASSPS